MHSAPDSLDHRPSWVSDAIFYQVFPDRFARSARLPKPGNLEPWDGPPTRHGYKGGDLLGLGEHLGWLVDLGVNAIYLNPIFQSASNHRYHPYDYFEVDPLLGHNEAFEELLRSCHNRGIRVVLDGVFNHASRGFFQFNDILENGDQSPYIDWFHVHQAPPNAYNVDRPPDYEAWWSLHALPKFNTENPEVREFLMQVAEHWLRAGIDGWRLDVPLEIKTEGFWEEFRRRVRAVNPEAYIVAEIWHLAGEWIGPQPRFDGVMNYPLTEALLRFTAGHRIDEQVAEPVNLTLTPGLDADGFRRAVDELMAVYPTEAHRANLNLLGSHDTARVLSVVGGDVASEVLAAAILFTLPGAPCIYYGDEVGVTGHHDPGSRAGFPWDRPDAWNRELMEVYRSLGMLRRSEPALRRGDYRALWADGMAFGFDRRLGDDQLVVVVNCAEDGADAAFEVDGARAQRAWGSGEGRLDEGRLEVALPARSAAVWRVR